MTAGPPLTEIVATPQLSMGIEDEQEGRKTHIEVCVRIRPLVISKESSTSFLSQSGASARSSITTNNTNNNDNNNGNNGRLSKLSSSPLAGSKLPTSRLSSRNNGTNGASKLAPPKSFIGSGLRGGKSLVVNPTTPPKPERVDRGDSNDGGSPLSENLNSDTPFTYAWGVVSHDTVKQSPNVENIKGRTDSYTLDHVYGPDSTTRQLFDQSVQGLVHAAMDGYHASVLAYGQTSTGKTHTMTGTSKQPGLIPLAITECFEYLKRMSQPREYLIRLSYMEVYKEHIRDLLVPQNSEQPAPIRLFETAADGLVIKGLKEEVVTSPDQVFAVLSEGESRRQVGATTMNAHSSRSHVIVRLWIESRTIPESNMSNNGGGGGIQRLTSNASTTSSLASSSPWGANVRVSSLSLVDLAGSESVKLTNSNERRQEGHYINQSLMTLGKVVYALSEIDQDSSNNNSKKASTKHIPYRDSKLTRLLQPSLSGNAQVVLVCCISPLAQHIEESHNTFKFAVRAKRIPQKATIQEAPDEERTLLQSYRDEIEELKRQLKEARNAKETAASASASTAAPPAPIRQPKTATTNYDFWADDVVSEDEIQELVSSIQTMERLILKSKPISPLHTVASSFLHHRPEDLIDSDDWDDDDDDEEDLIALASLGKSSVGTSTMSRSLQTPIRPLDTAETDKNLEIELARIQGLLGAVLKKRKHKAQSPKASSILTSSSASDQEVLQLRAQLEQQELATTIRKADSTFLQKQLEEKDDLLLEVSKILEAVEQRQIQLEKENAALRQQVAFLLKAGAGSSETTTTSSTTPSSVSSLYYN